MQTTTLTKSVIIREIGAGPRASIAPIPGSLQRVRFAAHTAFFLMSYSACENLQCPCRDVYLRFVEEGSNGRPLKSGLQFGVRVDSTRWQIAEVLESSPPEASRQVQLLVQELQESLSDELKKDMLTRFFDYRAALKNALGFKASAKAIRSGTLYTAGEIFGAGEKVIPGSLSSPILTTFEEQIYLLEDFYCLNPSCDCQNVHLQVARAVSGAKSPWEATALFMAVYNFAGKVELSPIAQEVTAEWGVRLLNYWLETDPLALGCIFDRYERLKGVGKRLLKKRRR